MNMNDLWQWIEREESHEDVVTPVPIVAFAVTLDRDERGLAAGDPFRDAAWISNDAPFRDCKHPPANS
jgi:hypothetical protein